MQARAQSAVRPVTGYVARCGPAYCPAGTAGFVTAGALWRADARCLACRWLFCRFVCLCDFGCADVGAAGLVSGVVWARAEVVIPNVRMRAKSCFMCAGNVTGQIRKAIESQSNRRDKLRRRLDVKRRLIVHRAGPWRNRFLRVFRRRLSPDPQGFGWLNS